MSTIRNIVLLGATGSIGLQAIDVVRKNPQHFKLVGLSANSSIKKLLELAQEFAVKNVAIADELKANLAQCMQFAPDTKLGFGAESIEALTRLDDIDIVLNALVGAAGMRATYATLAQGRDLALANKESLVVAGDLIMPLASHTKAKLLPVDSEHSAIFQCLLGERSAELNNIWLTASGGPFRGFSREALKNVDARQALAHPTWNMGQKISIDSATLMNKGLEVIEAKHLFNVTFEQIKLVAQPQSCIHSMVEYCDGSVKAHLGVTDMRIPIQYALSYPKRLEAPVKAIDFCTLGSLSFEPLDLKTFGALSLALEAGKTGGTAPAALNAANEVAVAAFLADRCGFLDIERIVSEVLSAHTVVTVESLEQLEEVDGWARRFAGNILEAI